MAAKKPGKSSDKKMPFPPKKGGKAVPPVKGKKPPKK